MALWQKLYYSAMVLTLLLVVIRGIDLAPGPIAAGLYDLLD